MPRETLTSGVTLRVAKPLPSLAARLRLELGAFQTLKRNVLADRNSPKMVVHCLRVAQVSSPFGLAEERLFDSSILSYARG